EIAQAASTGSELAAICNALIEHAKERGGADHITCILLHVAEMAAEPATLVPAHTATDSQAAAEAQPGTPPDEMEAFSPAI
ncbi:MAG TPA: hypothetical protein VGH84_09260, partial [Steroidobacteraceae bacterium]